MPHEWGPKVEFHEEFLLWETEKNLTIHNLDYGDYGKEVIVSGAKSTAYSANIIKW